jgi:hypothetical protein
MLKPLIPRPPAGSTTLGTLLFLTISSGCPDGGSHETAGGTGGTLAAGGSSVAGGNSGTGGGVTTPPVNPAAIEPLPPNSVAFFKGHVRQDINAWRAQIWAYELDTKKQRMVTDLDDNVSFENLAGGLELSPDRKWMAFSAFFRTLPTSYSVHTNLIWKVSVDGKQFVQVTPLPTDTRQRCDAQTACTGLAEQVCEEGRCTPFAWKLAYEGATWAPNSQTLMFHLVERYCVMYFCKNWTFTYPPGPWVTNASVAVLSDQPGVEPKPIPAPALKDCSRSNPMITPDGKRLAVIYDCAGASGVQVSDPDGSNSKVVLKGTLRQMAWAPDGTAIYYLDGNNKQLVRLDLNTNAQQVLLDTPADDPLRMGHFTVSADGHWLFFNQIEVKTDKSDVYLYDLTHAMPGIQKLTEDGVSSL